MERFFSRLKRALMLQKMRIHQLRLVIMADDLHESGLGKSKCNHPHL